LTVGFEVTASDPDGNIATYAFDFGDGNQEIVGAATTTHTYQRQGTYTAIATVKDTGGLEATSSNCRALITASTHEEARHFECTSDERCVEVIGSGTNQCLRDSDCHQAPEEPVGAPQPPAPPSPVPDTGQKSFLWLPLALGLSLILIGTLLFLNDPRWKKFEERIARR